MKKIITVVSLIMALHCFPAAMSADSYDALWKKVETERQKDLPKSQMEALKAIIVKAGNERMYGHLLKAELDYASLMITVTPDSLQPAVDDLVTKADMAAEESPVLAAIYNTVLGRIYKECPTLGEGHESVGKDFFAKALANPALLASCKATDYEPLVVEGPDSRYFDNDLLSMIGYEAEAYGTLHEYYSATGNRVATMFTALEMLKQRKDSYKALADYKAALDSLVNIYSDLTECGEVAIELYDCMRRTDATAGEEISYIDTALGKWGGWGNMNTLRNEKTLLTNPMFTVSMDYNVVLPDVANKVDVRARNLGSLTMTVSRVNIEGDTKLSPENDNNYREIKKKIVSGTTKTYKTTFKGKADYDIVTDSMTVEGLPVGVYLLEFATDNKGLAPQRRLLYVTDLYVVSQEMPGDTTRFAVLNATTGQPVPDAQLYISRDGDKAQTLECDANGEILYKNTGRNGMMIRPYTSTDKACPLTSSWNNFSYYGNKRDRDFVSLYTDRSIYRPGQTVHVSAVAFRNSKGTELSAIGGHNLTITLRDANYKVVKENTVITDDYGCASTDFVLPSTGLTGRFTITSNYGQQAWTSIRVEQYKRPTFRIEFDDVKQAYRNGDTLTVTGHATTYAGVPVREAKVKFTVSRRQSMWGWRYVPSAELAVLDEGETVTDADGAFNIRVPMVLPEGNGVNMADRIARFYKFTILADVTDGSNETHSGEKVLTLGTKPAILDCDIAEMTERDSIKAVTFSLKNASGNDIQGTVTYYVDDDSHTFTANANEPVMLQWGGNGVPVSGKHTLVATCEGDTIKREFVIFSIDDKRPAYDMRSWFYVTSEQFQRDGKPVYVQVGSSDEDVHILYSIISGDKLLESGVMKENNSINTRRFDYKDEYGDGILLTYTWVKKGKRYYHKTYIERPLPDKRLELKWTTFRDKLTPGQSETWTLSVSRPDGTPADARLLATMYDSSLDQIAPFEWNFNTYMGLNQPFAQWGGMYFNSLQASRNLAYKLLDVKGLEFNRIVFDSFYAPRIMIRGRGQVLMAKAESKAIGAMPMRSAQMTGASVAHDETADAVYETVELSSLVSNDANVKADATGEGAGNQSGAQEQVRENLNETAFFYPALATDADGNISIRFTLPESVTTWKFMGFAHDKEMNNGMIKGEAVAKKEVMVQPNMPRFLRLGDKASISSRIFNTSDKKAAGTIRLELINPETEKMVYSQSKKFDVSAGNTESVVFDPNTAELLSADKEFSTLYICKVVATGKTFSDGEQHYLPILPDMEMVTNTIPFTMHEAGTKTLDVKGSLPDGKTSGTTSKSAFPAKLTIEYTNNPAWLMVQALPYVSNANEKNAISLAASYYANSIGKYILGNSPQVKDVFGQWQQEQGNATSLASGLEKNEELKALALDETPWIADAEKEADQKQALANFFDENAISYRLGTTLQALGKLQNSDGSFSWCSGMKGSPCMTAEVMEFLTRLNLLTSTDNGTAALLDRANKYLSSVVVKEVDEMKRREKEGKTVYIYDYHALQFLYVNAISGRKLSAAEKSAADYLMKHLKENKLSQSLYAKALMAVVLANDGQKELAAEYVKSLKEYTTFTEEAGRYYDTPRAGYSWCDYRIPTQVAAIEALQMVTPKDDTTINEMKRWLLHEKRTQAWDTPVNSVNAVYAFFKDNMAVLAIGENAKITVNGKALDLPKATAGLGYVKTSLAADDVKTVTIAKTSEGTSWGAVYNRFMQPLDEIADASSGLTITREIVSDGATTESEKGKDETVSLKAGSRVKVRITIKADRDYDFVMVTDKRPACLEPVNQLSGYYRGYYIAPKDNATNYYFDTMAKGTHVLETEYYVDRTGTYETGTCTVQCAYSPEYMARTKSMKLVIGD